MNIFARYYNYLKTWRKHRAVIKDLNQLTNKQLKDIGITRGDIDNLMWLPEDFNRRGNKRND